MASVDAPEIEDEDDYLTMTFEEPTSHSTKETLIQKKKRLAREAEERGRPKSKAQIAEEERKKREDALKESSLDQSSKGFKMMAALGYKPGTALGKDLSNGNTQEDHRLKEPIGLDMKEDRSGIGADSEKKRKFREEVAKQADSEKRQKVEAGEFRDRQHRERLEKRQEGQYFGAMKVAERLEEGDIAEKQGDETSTTRPLHSYNVLWRGLVKKRLQSQREKTLRFDLDQSLSRLPTYDDPADELDDKIALNRKSQLEEIDLELDQDDPELEAFETLPPGEKLQQLVVYLRDTWYYCFWCKYRYPDAKMEECPGLSEEDHD